jgi:gliding motility-associated-like protein
MLRTINRLTLYLTILFAFIPIIAFSHHIAGADLSMQAVTTTNKNFRISLNIYIEDKNSPIAGANLEEIVVIFRKRDNAKMDRFFLRRNQPPAFLVFQNPVCADQNNLKIYRSIFYLDVFLDPNIYNDPDGYYIMFDRCCRSQELTNINDPLNTSLAVMLEFPSVKDVKNSSPAFGQLNGEFICKNEPFSVNFKATDADGDQLSYSLVDPYKGFASFTTSPYFDETPRANRPGVNWLSNYDKNNSIPGTPPLTINAQTGEINVTATKTGLFVFAILCEEYRSGKRIGSTRRDYILKVVDCSSGNLPKPVLNYNNAEIKNLTICTGNTANIETADNPDWAFQWKKDNINILNANANQFTITDGGNYTVVKSSKISCMKEAISEPLVVTITTSNIGVKIKSDNASACDGENNILTLENPDQIVAWYENNVFIKEDKSVTVNKSGQYEARVIGTILCSGISTSDKIDLNLYSKPTISTPQNSYLLCPGDVINLTTNNTASYTYQWYKDNIIIASANSNVYSTNETGNFTVKVKNQSCEIESQIFKVGTQSNCTNSANMLYIPNIFTPNNDGKNDTWEIKNIDKYPECEAYIFNRWGENIFYSKGYLEQWDGMINGRRAPADTYAFIIKMDAYNKPDIKGSFILIH